MHLLLHPATSQVTKLNYLTRQIPFKKQKKKILLIASKSSSDHRKLLRLSLDKVKHTLGHTASTRVLTNYSMMNGSSPHSASSSLVSVVIWLHGLGDTGAGWSDIKYQFSGPEFAHVKWEFPTAPRQPITCNGGYVMPAWFDMPEIPVAEDTDNFEDSVLKAVTSVQQIIDRHVATGISPDRILIGGFSQGGAVALNAGLFYKHTLAGIVVFSGWLAMGSSKSFVDSMTEQGKKTPVLWCHGTADRVVYYNAGKAATPVLRNAGVDCTFKSYKIAHSACAEELAELGEFIKSRLFIKSSSAAR